MRKSWQEDWHETSECHLSPGTYPVASYDNKDDPELLPNEKQEYGEYELDEPEATALNSTEELNDHAIQSQLAANAASCQGKGKGFNRLKGRGKGNGNVVRSHLTLEQGTQMKRFLCGGTPLLGR